MSKMKLHFKIHSLRTQASPYNRTDDGDSSFETIYYLLVNMRDLPEQIPLDVNPRVPKMTTNPAKNLVEAVKEPETDFYINNRGIAISAKSLSFDTKLCMVTIDLGDQDNENDKYQYGILDGGHTYKAIMDNRDEIADGIEKYVRVEVITNVQNITRLSDARNTSVQVSDIALFNLDDKFEDVKAAIKDQPFANRIAYKDNEEKEIQVSELLRLMYAFDIESYPDETSAPVQSFSGKAQVFKKYKASYSTPFYRSLTKQIPKLACLFDLIEREIPKKYTEYKEAMGITNSKFGKVRGIELIQKSSSNNTSFYFKKPIQYRISTGYIYPIFGAFRCLLQYDAQTEQVSWLFDPLEIWKDIGTSLVQNTFESSNNPQLVGKDKRLWRENYRTVETRSLKKLLKQNKITRS